MAELGRNDRAMLLAALKKNGGGIDSDMYPEATRKRLMKAGLLQWKPNQRKSGHYAMLMTLTERGSDVAKAIAMSQKSEADETRFGEHELKCSPHGHGRPSERPCTCHPDDNPPQPCAKRYALTECKAAHALRPNAGGKPTV